MPENSWNHQIVNIRQRSTGGGKQTDQLYFGMLGRLIAFLWSAAEYLFYNCDMVTGKLLFNNSTEGTQIQLRPPFS